MTDTDIRTTSPRHKLSKEFVTTSTDLFGGGDLDVVDDIKRHGVSADFWFTAELSEALRGHALTPGLWGELTHCAYGNFDPADDWIEFDMDMRSIWGALAPDRRFPWDESGGLPPELEDHPNADGISDRLVRTLRRLVDEGDVCLVGRELAVGTIPHVPRFLETEIRAGRFTPEIWTRIAYRPFNDNTEDGSVVPPEVVDRDLRALWTEVYPDRPYPAEG